MGNDENLMDEIYQLLKVDKQKKKLIDIINERIVEYGISYYQIGQMLSINKNTFLRLIEKLEKGDVQSIDFYDILKIAQFLNIGIDEISQFYVASLKPEFIGEIETARKANYLLRYFDLKGLKDAGFIGSVYDIAAIEKRIVTFFGLDSLFQYSTDVGAVLFSRTKNTSHDKMRDFWVRSAYYQFEKINNPNPFDKEKLLAIIPKIRPYTRQEEKGFATVVAALYNIGVTVIVQTYLSKTEVRGGTFVVNGKPCIVITDRGKNYATLWFALMHEIYHTIYDFEELKSWKYHLTGEADLHLFKEDLADYFACEMLFPKEKLNYIRPMINSPIIVNEYSEQNKIHPSIIYNFYCYDEKETKGNNYYPFYQKYFGKADKAIKKLEHYPFNKEKITENVDRYKALLTAEPK